ncbi:MAG TPA: T9SS type A sorting domain-containing protein, partial [Pelobium sp.]|nr:T9SS type A sorting domain-containing protein [Pelobium sp.]
DLVNVNFAAGIYEKAELIGLGGQILQSQAVGGGDDQLSFDVSRLSPATYMIRLSGAKGSITKPLVKK